MTRMRYARAPSHGLLFALKEGLLAPLLEPWTASGLPLDVQFRENDSVALYCGLTRLLVARHGPPFVFVDANPAYTGQACARSVMRQWRLDAPGFREALSTYLRLVSVNARHTKWEGAVQADWWQRSDPWVPLDREAVIGGGLVPSLCVEEATRSIRMMGARWAEVDDPKEANEVDCLALDPAGRLALVEMKWGGAHTLYYAPLQVLRYAWEWNERVEALLPSLRQIITARQRLGLLPADLPAMTGGLRVAVAWGEQQPSAEVLRRLHAVNKEIQSFLPPSVATIELWTTVGGRPLRIS